jgi:cytochrome c oxidase subunit II
MGSAEPLITKIPRALKPPAQNPRRGARTVALAVLLALVALLTFAGSAFADAITPESGGSPNADDIDSLYKVILVLAVIIFVGVESALLYSVFKFKARKGAVAAQIRGNTRLEIGWTVGAALILVVLAVVTFIKLPGIRNPPNSDPNGVSVADGVLVAAGPKERLPPNGKSLNICVNGQQYIWRYTYAKDCDNAPLDAPFSYVELVAPTDTTVTLDIRSQDVAHSWWIPQLGGKFDAVPGYTNYTWFKIPGKFGAKPGGTTFRGQCAELCGRNHANMIAYVRAVSPQEFERWIAGRRRDIKQANQDAAQQRKRVDAGQNP